MDYMQLGKSGLNISRIGFGCMSLDPSNNEHDQRNRSDPFWALRGMFLFGERLHTALRR